jgi:RNA polymerase sigma factor (sigma-70 family)
MSPSDDEIEPRPADELVGDVELLFTRRYDDSVRLAYLLTGSQAIAEDLVQECFARLLVSRRPVANQEAYLRRMVVNASRSHFRRRAVERRWVRANAHRDLTEPGPDESIVTDLRSLSGRQREAVVLRYFLDLPDHEIARQIGCREATVRSLLHRALARLREVETDDERSEAG